MSLFTQMIQLQMQILLMLGIGFFLRKKEIVTVEIRKGLSALLINVVLPCTVILSFISRKNATKKEFRRAMSKIK